MDAAASVAGSVLLIHAVDSNFLLPTIVGSKVKLNALIINATQKQLFSKEKPIRSKIGKRNRVAKKIIDCIKRSDRQDNRLGMK